MDSGFETEYVLRNMLPSFPPVSEEQWDITTARYRKLIDENEFVTLAAFFEYAQGLGPYGEFSPVEAFEQDFMALIAAQIIAPVISVDGEETLLNPKKFYQEVTGASSDYLRDMIDRDAIRLRIFWSPNAPSEEEITSG
jgi:hypothetical protein